jgi:toxin-antitoxin system PIN domain toxin
MDLLDVNVLVNAFRPDASRHQQFLEYVQSLVASPQPFAVPSIVFSGFLRIVTNPKIFNVPNTFADAAKFADQLQGSPNCLIVSPGDRHWALFVELCSKANARGNFISDAYLAAIAIELGAELVSDDRGMARWPGLKWRRPVND